jgi:hypothetical protein
MAEHGSSDPYVFWIVHRDRSCGTVPEEMSVYRPAKGSLGALGDGNADGVWRLWLEEIADP